MRASAVPTCWPASARMMLTVTLPSRSILYQMVGPKALGAAAREELVPSAVAKRATGVECEIGPDLLQSGAGCKRGTWFR